MKNTILKWSLKEYSKKQRILALIPAGLFFLIVIPLILIIVSPYLDRFLKLPKLILGPFNIFIALILIIPGLLFAGWSVLAQFKIGKGTPVPIIPTQKLVVVKPFNYSRNPMTLGTILYYLGIGVWLGSLSTIAIAILIALILITYIKLVEEKELEARFGQEYIEYKKRTPFIISRKKK